MAAPDDQSCPRCGGKEVQPVQDVLKRHFNPWAFWFGGWLISLLWSGSRKEDVRCLQCETVFQRHTRVSRVAWVVLVIIILLTLLCLLAEWFGPPSEL